MWRAKKQAGTLKRPSLAELFAPQFRKTTLVTTLMFTCAYGVAFGAIQQVPRIVPGLEDVRLLPRPVQEQTVSNVQLYQEIGGLMGRLALAYLAVRILGRRRLLRVFQVPGLVAVPVVFFLAASRDVDWIRWGIFVVGFFSIAQLSFWGNYLPRVYPTYLRGTGEGFAANVGGRMLGTGAAFVTAQLASVAPGAGPTAQLAYAAALVGTACYVIGFLASYWLPEPERQALPE
jgi:hypothetical protein